MAEEDIKEYAVKKGIDVVEMAVVAAITVTVFLSIFGGDLLNFVRQLIV